MDSSFSTILYSISSTLAISGDVTSSCGLFIDLFISSSAFFEAIERSSFGTATDCCYDLFIDPLMTEDSVSFEGFSLPTISD